MNRRLCYFVALYCVHAVAVPVAAQASKKLTSPTGKYSVDIIRNSQEALVFRQSGRPLAKISTPVGPVDSRFEALWSPEESYVAINKQRSSRPGGDECGSLLCLRKGSKETDGALWSDLEKKAWLYVDEKHLNETGGKVFLTLAATKWEKARLRFRLEVRFSEIEDRYFFEGAIDPPHAETIIDWKITETRS